MNTLLKQATVLVVDDHRFQRAHVRSLLREAGIHGVLEACNGQAALEIMQTAGRAIDLIICDIDMPKMDGLEFLRWLGRIAPRSAFVIHSALSSNILQSVEAMALEYGLRPLGILEDPITVGQLSHFVERALDRPTFERATTSPVDISISELEQGVARREFEPWFQPKQDLKSGQIIGVEALLRWRRRERTLGPAQFLPVLEGSGLLKDCTLRLATRAAECMNLLNDRSPNFSIAINVTPTLLDDPEFAKLLTQALASGGARPDQVVIELTETAMNVNQGAMLENLARLRMRGFQISLDDFCTGYSSMARLVKSPFSELKIDRSFVSRMYPGNREWLLIESTVALAQRLGLRTVAEGVETHDQLEALKEFGCDVIQGFVLSQALPVLELMQWMERRSHRDNHDTVAGTLVGCRPEDLRLEETAIQPSATQVARWLKQQNS